MPVVKERGATAQNCLIRNNSALNGGGIFCEKGGLVRNCTIENNEAESMGGGGIFMQEGGWIANSIIDGNIATNGFARGGGGLFFYNDGGKVNSSTIEGNTSVVDGGIGTHHNTYVDPLKIGQVNHSILWNNLPSQGVLWNGTGNQTVDPETVNAAPGANLAIVSYDSDSSRATTFTYDLNGNPAFIYLPNGMMETRVHDALNRMTEWYVEAYSPYRQAVSCGFYYDAVGNLRSMSDAANAHSLVDFVGYLYEYDNAYRLVAEQLTWEPADGTAPVPPPRRTEFDWDAAGNRTAMRKYSGGSLASTTTYKTPSKLNQMTGWTCGETNTLYTYDANGNRQDQFIRVGGTTEATNYEYDEDNRLTKVTVRDTEKPKTYSFGYDYRTRRISRETSTEKTVHVFDGGLSVQEYDTTSSSTLSINNLTTESVRTDGLGGGVGGMVYSIRNGQLEASHSNHRGDVVARTDNQGNLTWFARYDAYGSRFDEFGATYDRQRGNTKDEEESLNLLNQGMRWEDHFHGVWLSRDPIGFGDGPNLYAYVHCNPITHFDATGLKDATPEDMRRLGFTSDMHYSPDPPQADEFGNAMLYMAVTQIPGIDTADNIIGIKDSIDTLGNKEKIGALPRVIAAANLIVQGADELLPGNVPNFNKLGKKFEKVGRETLESSAKEAIEQAGKKTARKEHGSYTNTHQSGNKYHGQGDKARSQVSGKEKSEQYNDPHVATDWTPAESRRQAMKDEAQRIREDGGKENQNNYNKIESPGKRYSKEDGD